MKKSKKFIVLLLSILMCVSIIALFPACKRKEREEVRSAATIVNEAVEKSQKLTENLFLSNKQNASPTATEPFSSDKNTYNVFSATPYSKNSWQDNTSYSRVYEGEVLSYQVYLNYPFNIIEYLLDKSANRENGMPNVLEKTVYGTAIKTINDQSNEFFENYNGKKPSLYIKINKTENGVEYIANWDWRNNKLADAIPQNNAVLYSSGKIEYDYETNEVTKLTMAWNWGIDYGDVVVGVIDFKNNDFSMLRAYGNFAWKADKIETITSAFNKGELTSEKLKDYPHSISVINSNITTETNALNFIGYKRNITKDALSANTNKSENYEEFCALYNSTYEKLKHVHIPNEKDTLSHSESVKIKIMDDAANYGLRKTEFVVDESGLHFLHLDEEAWNNIFDAAERSTYLKERGYLSYLSIARKIFNKNPKLLLGDEAKLNGLTCKLEYCFDGNASSQNRSEFAHWCSKFNYKLIVGKIEIAFTMNGKELKEATLNGVDLEIISLQDYENLEYYTFSRYSFGYKIDIKEDALNDNADIIIPQTYDKLPIVQLGDSFKANNKIKSINIPGSVEELYYTFENCQSLEKVTLSSGTKWITGAFKGCTNLKTIHLPNTIEEVCATFENCQSLETITLPEGLKRITYYTFKGCTNLKEISIPKTVDGIYETPFYGINATITVHEENSFYKSIDGNLLSHDGKTLFYCSIDKNATSYEIPIEVEHIEKGVFENCSNLTTVTLPHSLRTINDSAFKNCTSLKNINFGENIESIYSSAFEGCISLPSYLSLPYSLNHVSENAFKGCKQITELDLFYGTYINERAFIDCPITKIIFNGLKRDKFSDEYQETRVEFIPQTTNTIIIKGYTNENEHLRRFLDDLPNYDECLLTNLIIELEEGITTIASREFNGHGYDKVTTFILPDSLISIGNYAFEHCSSLSKIQLGTNLQSIGYNAFCDCHNLREVYNKSSLEIKAGSSDYGYIAYYAISVYTNPEDNVLKPDANGFIYGDSDHNTLIGYNGSKTDVIIPNTVKTISENAFAGLNNLTTIYIPNSVAEIKRNAFKSCKAKILWENNPTITTISSFTFFGYQGNTISIPNSVTFIENNAFTNCYELQSITLSTSMSSISGELFANCTSLKNITIPNSITRIEVCAFENCSSLTEIIIPNSVTFIDNNAFTNCYELQSITLSTSMSSISGGLFENCTSLKNITIPNSITRIEGWAFKNCSSLTEIIIPNSVTYIGDNAFSNCSSLTSIAIPNSVTYIGDNAFSNCSSLTSLVINNTECVLCDDVFYNCPIIEATLPIQALSCIGKTTLKRLIITTDININEALKGFTALESVTLSSNDITRLPQYTFKNCSSLKDIKLPNSLSVIELGAFFNCTALESIDLPNSLTVIGEYAFSGCSSLKSIIIPSSVTNIEKSAFARCTSLKFIYFNSPTQLPNVSSWGLTAKTTVVWGYNEQD